MSEAWVRRALVVPADGNVQLQFRYRILSYDLAVGSEYLGYKEYDPFEVYVNGKRVLREGINWSPEWQDWYKGLVAEASPLSLPAPQQYPDSDWSLVSIDLLHQYAGQAVSLEFRVPNRQSPVDNTWVYIDDIQLTARPQKIYLPLLIR